jgi:N-acyl-D-amino-acid deacylase
VSGNHADVAIFDAATIKDRATYDTPTVAADGVAAVIVNGELTRRRGEHRGARAGEVLVRSPLNQA